MSPTGDVGGCYNAQVKCSEGVIVSCTQKPVTRLSFARSSNV